MTVTEALLLANDLKNKHIELLTWSVTHNRRKRSFGVCSYTKREIQLSILLIPTMTDEAIFDTIVHEIAHALTPGHGHDNIWKRKCIELGGDGQRTGSSEKFKDGLDGKIQFHKVASKYTLTCPCCGYTTFMNRKPKRSYSCGKHGVGYDSRYKLILTQNY